MYAAYDPGKVTGFALFNDDGTIRDWGQLTLDQLIDHVSEIGAVHNSGDALVATIYETFQLFSHKALAQSGSTMEASQAIGIIKTLIRTTRCREVKQPPSIKPIAQKWSGVVPLGKHSESHKVDAYNHGVYFLVKNDLRKTLLEENLTK